MRRVLMRVGIVLAVLVAAGAFPIGWTELSCKAPPDVTAPLTPFADTADRRAEGDSFLSYPEWYIVHAYADLAGVMRQSSESSVDYIASISGVWTSLCGATRTASRIGSMSADQRVTNYIIGLSFTAEMAVKGLWERTIGALAVLTRGHDKTEEDMFAQKVADDYAQFLQQTPWYRYPFAHTVWTFWRTVPLRGEHAFRKWERRVALSLEWGVKSVYAKAMDALAGASPAALTIRSVVRDLSPEDAAAVPRMRILRPLGDGLTLVETPRYEAFTTILRELSDRRRNMVEIAGNTHILTTVLSPAGVTLDIPGAHEIFSLPIQSRPGWRRIGLDTDVAALTRQIGAVERQGAIFEHAYDY